MENRHDKQACKTFTNIGWQIWFIRIMFKQEVFTAGILFKFLNL